MGHAIKIVGIAVSACILGALGCWWWLQGIDREPQNLQAKIDKLASDRSNKERANSQLRKDNQQLQHDNASLQEHVVALNRRVSVLEDTKIALEDRIEDVKKRLVVPEKSPVAKNTIILPPKKDDFKKKTVLAKSVNLDFKAIQSLGKDKLARLIIKFLITYEHSKKNGFNAFGIQSFGGDQEGFDLFIYHPWSAIDARLRRMERLGLVKGRAVDDPNIGRLFTIKHGEPLATFQTLAAN